ncbi:MAG: glycosyltransferase [Pseudomonadota bacterium]
MKPERVDKTAGAGRLVAVVVTHNRLAQLQQTVPALLSHPASQLEAVIVVDNASSDGTQDWLEGQDDPRLHVMRSEVNGGGAQGFALGMERAVTRFAPDWLVLMDDDARPEPGALADFHAMDLSHWDAVAAAVYFPNGEICEMNRPSRNPFWHAPEFFRTLFGGGRSGFHLRPQDYEASAPRAIEVTSFVGFFISADAVARAGYPDPGLFLYGDDGLYTLEMTRAGGRIGFAPTVRFVHDLSTFTGQRGRFRPLWKLYYYHRNLLMLYRLAAGWLFWPSLLIVLPKWALKARDHRGESGVFWALMLRAVRDGLLRRTDVPHDSVLGWAGDAKR